MGRYSDIKLGQLQRQLEDVESIMLGIMHGNPGRHGSNHGSTGDQPSRRRKIRHGDRHFSCHAYFAQRAVNDARVAPVRCHQNMLGAGIVRQIEAFLAAGNADVSISQKRLSIAGVA